MLSTFDIEKSSDCEDRVRYSAPVSGEMLHRKDDNCVHALCCFYLPTFSVFRANYLIEGLWGNTLCYFSYHGKENE